MNNYEQFREMMVGYLEKYKVQTDIETTLKQASYNSQGGNFMCNSELPVVNMDKFAKKSYRKIILPNSISEDDTINTADAFLIDKGNKWYFIEFKDGIVKKEKGSILKKAYSNMYAVLDILYDMRNTESSYGQFLYDSPMQFIKKNVSYVFVFNSEKNPEHVLQERNHMMKQEHYTAVFMERLKGYIYHEAYAMSEQSFQNEFVKNFQY
jgi:hypothetical protein